MYVEVLSLLPQGHFFLLTDAAGFFMLLGVSGEPKSKNFSLPMTSIFSEVSRSWDEAIELVGVL